MRNFDLAPLYRATVGFDQIADLLDRVMSSDVAQPTYPPYNIEKTADDAYRISIAVAGFSADDLGVEVKDGSLVVSARKSDEDEGAPICTVALPPARLNAAFSWPIMCA